MLHDVHGIPVYEREEACVFWQFSFAVSKWGTWEWGLTISFKVSALLWSTSPVHRVYAGNVSILWTGAGWNELGYRRMEIGIVHSVVAFIGRV